MKITVFSESPYDEAALKVLIEGILGEKIEEVPRQNQLRSRGFSSVLTETPVVIRSAYYQNVESEAVVIVCDSDDEPVHNLKHEEDGNQESQRCRLCSLRRIVDDTLATLKLLPHRPMIKIAIGVAVPAIEAWYLCGVNGQVNEAAWIRKQNGEPVPYDRKSLKVELYGNDRPALEVLSEKAIESAERLIQDLERLEEFFLQGFACLANEIRGWKQ